MDIHDYEDLPEDSELAFATREAALREELWEAINENSTYSYDVDRKLNYLSKVMAFHDAHDLNLIVKPEISRGSNDFDFVFDRFLDDMNYLSERIKVADARRKRAIATVISLDGATKKQIHHLIGKIRETLEPIELPVKKKESIFSKLNALAYEVDCERTKGEAFAATVIEVASVTGEAAKRLAPVKDLLDSVGGAIGKAIDAYEARKLSAPKEIKRIEAPKKQLPPPKQDMDDEIPF